MNNQRPDMQEKQFQETVVEIKRISKKTKGGNQIRFSALVVLGDKNNKVGVALSKAKDVRSAVRKAVSLAERNIMIAPIVGTTIPFETTKKYKSAKIIIKPAPKGSGIIAGGPMRVVLESAGIKDAVGKILGTKNKTTNVYATFEALKDIKKLYERKQ